MYRYRYTHIYNLSIDKIILTFPRLFPPSWKRRTYPNVALQEKRRNSWTETKWAEILPFLTFATKTSLLLYHYFCPSQRGGTVPCYSWYKRQNKPLGPPPPPEAAVETLWPSTENFLVISFRKQIYNKVGFSQWRGCEAGGWCRDTDVVLYLTEKTSAEKTHLTRDISVIRPCLSQVQDKHRAQLMLLFINSSPSI